jgi:hypothetical protein
MNMDVYGWTSGARWLGGAFFVAVAVWAVVVVKRAVVGKHEWVHWDRILHHHN